MIRMEHRPSISAVCKNLSHWTVVLIPRDGFRVECIFTDENDLQGALGYFETLSRVFRWAFRGCRPLEL